MQASHDTADAAVIYLALGSNLGDRRANLAAAITRLGAQVAVEQISAIYESEPAYIDDQPRFLNAALRGRTHLPPEALLAFLKAVERELGRLPGPRFGPRLIDLDILLYAEVVLTTDQLTIPHPRMAERPFVLVPLAEIAPNLVPPGWTATVGDLAGSVRGQGDVRALVGRLDEAR